MGTAIQSEGDGLLLVEVFLYHEAEKHWNLDSMLSGQSQLTIRDGDHIYHISTMDPSSSGAQRRPLTGASGSRDRAPAKSSPSPSLVSRWMTGRPIWSTRPSPRTSSPPT